MYVEITNSENPKKFSIQELSMLEMEVLQLALVEVKQRALQDAEAFKNERTACNEMFLKIDQELRNSRS